MPLQPEDRLERLVQRRGRRRVVAVVAPRDPPRDPRGGRQREEQRVEIAELAGFQPRLLDRRHQRPLGIAAVMMVHHVMRRPHPLMRRDGDQDLAARLQAGLHRRQRGDIVLDMLDHIEHRDQVVRPPLDPRQFGERRGLDRLAEPLRRDLACGGIDLDRVDRAEARQHGQIVPGAAADLQDAGAGGQLAIAGQIVRQDVAARAIPPMGGIMRGHAVVNDTVHELIRRPIGG